MATNTQKMIQNQQIAYGSDQLPLRIGTLELPCFILTDKNAVFTRSGVQKALGYDGKSRDWLFDLLSSINKFYPVSGALFEALEKPIVFFASDNPEATLEGFSPDTVVNAFRTIVNAKKDGYIGVGQLRHAKAAAAMLAFFEKHPAQPAVEEATGLHFLKDAGKSHLRDRLVHLTGDAAYQWIPTLRDDFWDKIFEIHALDWHSLRTDPEIIAGLLHESVFSRLTSSLSETLRMQIPKRAYRRAGKPAISTEHPELRAFLSELLSLLNASANNWTIFLQLLNRIYPKTNPTTLAWPEALRTNAHSLDEQLKKAVSVNRLATHAHKKRA